MADETGQVAPVTRSMKFYVRCLAIATPVAFGLATAIYAIVATMFSAGAESYISALFNPFVIGIGFSLVAPGLLSAFAVAALLDFYALPAKLPARTLLLALAAVAAPTLLAALIAPFTMFTLVLFVLPGALIYALVLLWVRGDMLSNRTNEHQQGG